MQRPIDGDRIWVGILFQLLDTRIAMLRPEYQSLPVLHSRDVPGPAAVEVPGHFFDTDDDSQEASEEVSCCAEG